MGNIESGRRSMAQSGIRWAEDNTDSNLASVLQYFIRRGHIQTYHSSDGDDSDVDIVAPASPPRIKYKPNTKKLKKSDITLITKQASGLMYEGTRKCKKSMPAMILSRQTGKLNNSSFSQKDKCRITNKLLPNTSVKRIKFTTKMFCGVYSEDGSRFLTASQDRYIRVYDTRFEGYKEVTSIQARDVGWSILDTAFSPDGQSIAYSSWSPNLHLCRISDTENHETLALLPDDRRFCIFSVIFSSDGREILGGANDGHLYVYDLECQQRILRIEGTTEDVNTVAFADNTSQILYSGGDDGFCKVWDRRTLSENRPKPVGVLAGHMDGITYIDSKGDSRYLISNSKDQRIKLWDIRQFSSEEDQEFTRHIVSRQNWDYRWQAAPSNLLKAKDKIPGDASVMTYRGHSVLQSLIRCHFSPAQTTGQRFIYTGCASGRVVIYDLLTGKVELTLKAHDGCVRDVSWHPYRPEIASTSWDNSVVIWEYRRQETDYDSQNSEEESPPVTKEVRRSSRIAEQQKNRNNIQQRNTVS